MTVKANTGVLAKTGFSFAGWNTAANGTGTDYASTGSVTLVMGSVVLRLYAKWTALPTFTVTYQGNGSTGGSVPTDATAYYAGQTVAVLANSGALVRTGYVFGGWNTLANGTGTSYAAGSGTLVMGSANVTLYATWIPTFTVRYNGNGNTEGSVPADPTAYISGQNVNVLSNDGDLRKGGSTFTGWNTAADGTGTHYDASGDASFVIGAADVTLYASWVVIPKYTVTYDGNGNTGGHVPVDPTAYESHQVVTVLANSGALVKAGSYFAGWNTAVDGSGSDYVPEAGSFDIQRDTVLYAHWLVPQVTELSPAGGSTDGGTLVTFSGANLEGTTAVDFGGDAASGIVASATSVTCYAPARSPGVVAVTLTTPAGVVAGGTYTYQLPGPSISSMTPVEGSTLGGTTVSIHGNHLTGTTTVAFDGLAATEVVVVSDDLVTCSTPSHAAGIVDVVVTSPTGSATMTGGYTYSPPILPAFISFQPSAAGGFYAPTHVMAVWIETADGTFVRTVGDWSGERRDHLSQWAAQSGIDTDAVMGPTRSAMTVVRNLTWDLRDREGHGVSDGTYVLWIELVDADEPDAGIVSVAGARRTHLTFTVASQAVVAVGPVDQDGFTGLEMGSIPASIPAPVLSTISPSQGVMAGGTTMVLTGTHLSGTTSVKVGGVLATAVKVESDTRVTCITPMGAAGPAVVEIITDGGADARPGSFTYVAAGGSAFISFIPSAAGGGYAPKQVVAVWIESSSGAFVRTVGTWSETRRPDLTQWQARSGGDADAVMGATRAVAAPVNNLVWDMRDRSGSLVPDGTYRLWIEVVDDNHPAAGTASVVGARRTNLAFTVSGHAVATVGPVDQDGFTSLSMGSEAGSVLGNVTASQVAEDQQAARCGGGSVYAVILGGALLAVRRRRSGRG